MKKSILFLALAMCTPVCAQSTPFVIDEIKAIIYGVEDTELILKSDITRLSLEGQPRTYDDVVMERLMYLEAKRYKIVPDEEGIDRHLATVQRENDMNLEQLKEIFKRSGYTYAEGREQFAMASSVGTLLDFKVRSRLIIAEKDIKAYYDANSVHQEAKYQLERAVVSSSLAKERIDKALAELRATGESVLDIEWGTPFWLQHDQVSDKLKFVFDMKIGDISEPSKVISGFEFYRLKDKKERRLTPLEERYNEIVGTLRGPKYQRLVSEYQKFLFDNTVIIKF